MRAQALKRWLHVEGARRERDPGDVVSAIKNVALH
jgi:hypothetical protein